LITSDENLRWPFRSRRPRIPTRLWTLLAGRGLLVEDYPVRHADLLTLNPYQTRHIKRFGGYVFTVTSPEPFDGELATLVPDETSSLEAVTA
jgi:hypothetical protein